MGTKFTVYDNGVNPQKASSSTLESGVLRQELAAVCYVSPASLGLSGLQVRHNTEGLPDLWAFPSLSGSRQDCTELVCPLLEWPLPVFRARTTDGHLAGELWGPGELYIAQPWSLRERRQASWGHPSSPPIPRPGMDYKALCIIISLNAQPQSSVLWII